uniref:Leucine rich immune protein (Coil-less) n=1 Tax=Anopheles minimus TaxID=112268 RepID=A0A182WJA2_9DIPT
MASDSLELLSAPFLMHLAFVPNRHLSTLYIVNSAVQRIPETIINLFNLRFLGIEKASIRVLDLGLLCALRNLKTLQLMLGPENNLTWIEFDQLHLPASSTLTLSDNQIKRLPFLNHNNIHGLERVYLDGNQLSTVDLAQFHKHQQIDSFHFARNQIHAVGCRQRVHLPMLVTMELSTNKLESISLENCSFPNLNFIGLGDNRFQRVPAEIYVSEVSPECVLNIPNNPLQCSSLWQHVKLLTAPNFYPKLLVTTAANSELDITTIPEGLNTLQQELSTIYTTIQVQRLVIGSKTPIASLLIDASTLTNNLHFKKYHEKTLLLPSALTLEELTLQEARKLQTITIHTNRHLKQLEITQCALSIIPASIRNIMALKELRIKFCAVKTLNLGLLATLKHLETVQFVGYNVTNIHPPQTTTVQNFRTIDLSYNTLRQIDMSVFRTSKRMIALNLANNRLSTIDYPPSGVVTLPDLVSLYLANNMMERLSFVQLNASSLEFLALSFNRLTTVPEQIDKFAKLSLLALGHNGLQSFDFTILKRLSNLQRLELQNNRLQTVDLPREILLPNLNLLSLSNNQLKSIALEQLTAPRLAFLDLSNNLLMAIPDVFAKDIRQLQSVNVIGNPLACGTYEQYRKYIRLGIILPKWVTLTTELCSTGKYFVLTRTKRVCCMT